MTRENSLKKYMNKMSVRITLTEEMLGMSPDDKEIYSNFIASRNPNPQEDEKEEDYIEEGEVKGRTIYPKLKDGTPFLWDYQLKGFFKDACGMLSRVVERDEKGKKKKGITESAQLSSYKKNIDGLIFTFPRKIAIQMPEGAEIGDCQRPLRAQTAKGERIALASSETVPAGSVIEFDVKYLSADLEDAILEWLDYGEFRGLCQWRNSGKGTFTYEIIKNIEEIDLDVSSKKKIVLVVGGEVEVNATVSPEDTTDTLVWESSNPKIFTVENGVLKGVSVGTAELRVKANKGPAIATRTVTVKSK